MYSFDPQKLEVYLLDSQHFFSSVLSDFCFLSAKFKHVIFSTDVQASHNEKSLVFRKNIFQLNSVESKSENDTIYYGYPV